MTTIALIPASTQPTAFLPVARTKPAVAGGIAASHQALRVLRVAGTFALLAVGVCLSIALPFLLVRPAKAPSATEFANSL